MSVAFAHAHLAAIDWPVMMVVGLSYRLIPMIVPAERPIDVGDHGLRVLQFRKHFRLEDTIEAKRGGLGRTDC